jgi:hypothetical protein
MAYQRDPNNPYQPNRADDEIRDAASPDREPQPDPGPAGGPGTGTGRIALFAVAIAVVLGAVFYGLNNSSNNSGGSNTAQTAAPNRSTAETSPPPVPPGVRDVTPHNNTAPGVTTGAAPAQPQQPARIAPPANNAPAVK